MEEKPQRTLKPESDRTAITPRNFVLSIYPQAYCKSKEGRRGPYSIYISQHSQTEIAKGKGTAAAWKQAAKKLRTGSVLQQQKNYSNTDTPKVYAIKS